MTETENQLQETIFYAYLSTYLFPIGFYWFLPNKKNNISDVYIYIFTYKSTFTYIYENFWLIKYSFYFFSKLWIVVFFCALSFGPESSNAERTNGKNTATSTETTLENNKFSYPSYITFLLIYHFDAYMR